MAEAPGARIFCRDDYGSIPATEEALFENDSAANCLMYAALGRAWDVDPSGERFLMIRAPDAPETGAAQERLRIEVVVNWAEELKTRVPME